MSFLNEDTKTDYFAFGGGLNQVGPPMNTKGGEVLDSVNYEPDVSGGYRRVGGYERFDGRSSPSGAIASGVACTFTAVPAVGATVVCGAQSAIFVRAITGGMLVANATGVFPASTAITVGGVQKGTTAVQPNLQYAGGTADEAQALYDCATVLRAAIGVVPGSGPVRGIWQLQGNVYAVRDNAGATAGAIYKATAAGWVLVPLMSELKFTAGQAATFAEGETVKGATSGATGIVRRIVKESGLFTGTAVGRLIVDTLAGVFQAGELLKSSVDAYAATRATASGAAAAITIAPGGTYETVNHNFYGQAGTRRTYGVSGVGKAFEFDGAVYIPLTTGLLVDQPNHVAVHKNYLFVSYNASAMNSSVGSPYEWQALTGAVELAVGSIITGFRKLVGEALGIFTRTSVHQLLGAASDKWDLQGISPESGAVPGTIQNMNTTLALDGRGLVQYDASQKYGNFEYSTVSRKVQTLIDSIRGKILGSYIVRQRNQYRLLLTDGRVVVVFIRDASNRDFMVLDYGLTPSCVNSDTGPTDIERIFMGDQAGYVYEMDKGSSFDGKTIEAYLRMWHYACRSPRIRKRFRKAVVDMTAGLYSIVQGQGYFSYGDSEVQATAAESNAATGSGALWDTAAWDSFFWDGEQISQPNFRIDGTGINVSLLFYSNSKIDLGHLLQGVTLHFTPRRLQR